MLHTSLYMYIAKFLNVCIRTRSLSRSSSIPYLRISFGGDTCKWVSVKKRKMKRKSVLRKSAFNSFTNLSNSELLDHDKQTRHDDFSFVMIPSCVWD